jgi:hypothetical protein
VLLEFWIRRELGSPDAKCVWRGAWHVVPRVGDYVQIRGDFCTERVAEVHLYLPWVTPGRAEGWVRIMLAGADDQDEYAEVGP